MFVLRFSFPLLFRGLDDFEKMERLDLKICGIEFCWDLGICSSDGWIVKNLIFVPFLPNWCPIGGLPSIF